MQRIGVDAFHQLVFEQERTLFVFYGHSIDGEKKGNYFKQGYSLSDALWTLNHHNRVGCLPSALQPKDVDPDTPLTDLPVFAAASHKLSIFDHTDYVVIDAFVEIEDGESSSTSKFARSESF